MMDIRALRPQFNKKRKPNWSENEISFLLREFEKNKAILTSKLCGETTSQQKRHVWKLICDGLNARNPYVKRTTEEVRRKWKNLLSASKRELMESKRPYVEGGPPPRPISSISRRVIKLRGTVRNPQPAHPHPTGQLDGATQQNPNYHGLPTMVQVIHNSNNIDSDDLDDLDDNLEDEDPDEFEEGPDREDNIQNANRNLVRLSPKKEVPSTTIVEGFTPNTEFDTKDKPSTGNLQIQEKSNHCFASEVSPCASESHVIQNGGRNFDRTNGVVSSPSSSPYSDVTPRHTADMLNLYTGLPEGYPIFTPSGLGLHPGFPMYHHHERQPRSTEILHDNEETVGEIQADMLRIQRDKLRLEKEVLELYKERMRMEVEWWRNRLQRTKQKSNI